MQRLRSKSEGAAASANDDVEHIERCLNILISKSLTADVVQLSGKKFYVRSGRSELAHSKSLEIIRGYCFNVKPGMGNLLLNFNIATSAFFRPILIDEFLGDEDTFKDSEASRWNILRTLRVFVEYPRKSLGSGKSGEDSDLNATSARIKRIGGRSTENIEDLFFYRNKQDAGGNFIQKPDGDFEKETEKTFVIKHLEAGKSLWVNHA